MRLLDCFIELIAYMVYCKKIVGAEQPEYERIKADVDQLIVSCQNNPSRSMFSQKDFDLAQFAVFAWIDETILGSSWQMKNRWQSEQLQRLHYQTVDAGELFFEKLNTLGPEQTAVREVYYMCLALGFAGRFCNPGDEILLNQLKTANLKLVSGPYPLPAYEGVPLFPEAYQREDGITSLATTRGRRFSLEILAGIGIPVVLYGALFLVYRFILGSVGQNFIDMVK